MTRPALVSVEAMIRIPELPAPEALYTVLLGPTLLAGMPHPTPATPWTALASVGFRHVVCLTSPVPAYDPAPLGLLHAVGLEDLYGGRAPRNSERELREIRLASDVVLRALQRGEGVIVHCEGGTGRTGTVIGLVLRGLGHSACEIVGYLDAVHRARGKAGWPESSWQAELLGSIDAAT